MRKKMLILSLVAVLLGGAAVPALAQDDGNPVTSDRTRQVRTSPPAWVDMPIEELKAEVEERAERATVRVENSLWLRDDKKIEILGAINSLIQAVDAADSNAAVVGLSISRVQLQRLSFRAERQGTNVDYDGHIAADAERATRRLDRITKVAGWAEAAGEEVETINSYLDEARRLLDEANGDGTAEARHDAVHISMARLVEAAVALDGL
jgi:hypothetical protein